MKRICSLFLLLMLSTFAFPQSDPTLLEIRDAAETKARAEAAKAAAAAAHEALFDQATDRLAHMANAVTAPAGSGGDVHASRQNFLDALGVAINAIEQANDKQSITLRFNPIPKPPLQLGLTLVARKGAIYKPVSDAIASNQRAATTALLQNEVDDFDDVAIAASIAPTSSKCTIEMMQRSFGPFGCWGRIAPTAGDEEKTRFRDGLSNLLLPEFRAFVEKLGTEVEEANTELGKFLPPPPPVSSIDNTRISQLPEGQRQAARAAAEAAGRAIANAADVSINDFVTPEAIAGLIDQQPLFTVDASYRRFGELGGPAKAAVTTELQFGLENLNTIAKKRRRGEDVSKQLKGDFRRDVFVFRATYNRQDDFELTTLPGLSDVNFAGVDEPSASDWTVEAQWGRQLRHEMNDRNSRFDIAWSGERSNKDSRRTKNRWVGKATLTLPVGTNFSIPVSLTWANKPEFVGDGQKKFGANFSLAYQLPWDLK